MSKPSIHVTSKYLDTTKPTYLSWASIPVFLIIFTGLSLLLSFEHYSLREIYSSAQADKFISLNQQLSSMPRIFWSQITLLGETIVLLPIVFLLTMKNRKVWNAIFYSIPLASVLSVFFKKFTAIPRPAAYFEQIDFHIIGTELIGHTSLPSGHTLTIFTVMIATAMTLFPTLKKSKELSILSLLILLSILVGLSRVAVGAHWPLDVVLGAVCGWFAGISGFYFAKKYENKGLNSIRGTKLYAVIFFILSLLLIIRWISIPHEHYLILFAAACSIVVSVRLFKEFKTSK